MKDIIKRVVVGLVSGGFLGYLFYLFTQNIVIVQGGYTEYNTLYYLVLMIICIFLFIFFAIYPVHFKMTKGTLFIIGLALIIIGDTVLLNDVKIGVVVADLFKVLGVVLTLLAWTNLLITDKVKKQSQNKKIEVIEV
ncbi:MAG: hypothetical protein WC875_00505 [Candidatus Absconditabacterales bacterium]